ncbi:peptidoglycan DD-metalloendopeptidase family protein [Anabaena sp. UHCC 0204]|uniref:peptidoglycan DD-metalloendopeptidase family protein n=1 Tax=Anabaena sp. UHCC 0204 TaxID=2590009 RepID=UPI001444E140|nr:peptidoglycan DD-metalloendopeptidase family protein [Anabaena sp. UHCC 0204]MTJ07441.1 peptidoglycan DD-metalloendopeptidase family protein [Anabaena sp. UHCC 0204]
MNSEYFRNLILSRLASSTNALLVFGCLLVGMSNKAEAASFIYWPVPSNTGVECGYGCYDGHVGIDIGVNTDNTTPIYAAADGVVINLDNNEPFGNQRVINPANGNYVKLRHDINGEIFYTWYLHLTSDVKVAINDSISVGQLLGYGSNSGYTCGNQTVSTGGCLGYPGAYSHLHFQVSTSCGTNACSKNPFEQGWWVKDSGGKIINATDAKNYIKTYPIISWSSEDLSNGNSQSFTDPETYNSNSTSVPEPSSVLGLFSLAVAGVLVKFRKKN